MDSELIEKKLKKINNIFNEFKQDGKIADLERDLLLAYIRELYDLIKTGEVVSAPSRSAIDQDIPITVESVRHKIDSEVAPVVEEKVQLPEPPAPAEVIAPKVEPVVVEEVKIPEPVQLVEQVQVTEPMAQPVVTVQATPAAVSSAVSKLFIIEKAKDLSERLAMTPISDINKSLSLNDKLLIQKDLFGGNQELFSNTVKSINEGESYEGAVAILQSIAQSNNWTSEDNLEKAQAFIKLVSRRFSK